MGFRIDIAALDEDPLSRQSMVECLRLFGKDFPHGIRHFDSITAEGAAYNHRVCLVCALQEMGAFQLQRWGTISRVTLSPALKDFLSNANTDEELLDAIKAWIVYDELLKEGRAS